MKEILSNKCILVTGGTGSFGNSVARRLLKHDIKELRIFSRDEKKQDDMRISLNDNRVKYYIGDVRDKDSLTSAVKGTDFIFHAAALKQVPSCEFFPKQATLTNIIGTSNVLDLAIHYNVDKVVVLSTDKAVYPINAMGISKALMEKIAISYALRGENTTTICVTRYGNVMASRGSVIPRFVDQIKSNEPITITNPNMTRFMMTLDDAVDLVLYAFKNGENGDLYVQKAPSCSIEMLANTLIKYYNKQEVKIDIIGSRHGEKLYEVLVGSEEMIKSKDLGDFILIPPDTRGLSYNQYESKGVIPSENVSDFNSHNCRSLNESELLELLNKVITK